MHAGQALCQLSFIPALTWNFKIQTVNYPWSNIMKKYYRTILSENHRVHSKVLGKSQGYGSPQNSHLISLNTWTLVVPTPTKPLLIQIPSFLSFSSLIYSHSLFKLLFYPFCKSHRTGSILLIHSVKL